MRFITITAEGNTVMAINVDHIVRMYAQAGAAATSVVLSNGGLLQVREKLEDLVQRWGDEHATTEQRGTAANQIGVAGRGTSAPRRQA